MTQSLIKSKVSWTDNDIGPTSLLDHHVDFITIFHFEAIWTVLVFDSFSIKNEAALVVGESLSLAVCVHQFLELGGSLDFEVDLGPILSFHFDIDMKVFASSSISGRCGCCGIVCSGSGV